MNVRLQYVASGGFVLGARLGEPETKRELMRQGLEPGVGLEPFGRTALAFRIPFEAESAGPAFARRIGAVLSVHLEVLL